MVAVEDTNGVNSQQDQYVSAFYVPTPPKMPPRWTWASCVEFAKWYTGHQGETWGRAADIAITSAMPYVGGFVLTNESSAGHMAVITAVASQSISLIEANWHPGEVSTRSLSLDSPLIRGFK